MALSSIINIIGKRLTNTYTLKCNARLYSRWSHRTPRKVLVADNDCKQEVIKPVKIKQQIIADAEKSVISVDLVKSDSKNTFNETKSNSKGKNKKNIGNIQEYTFDESGNFNVIQLKKTSGELGRLMVDVKSGKRREKNKSILLEGKRLIREGLSTGCTLQTLLFSRESDIESLRDVLPKSGITIYKLPYKELELWSGLSTCPGIIGLFNTPNLENYTPVKNPLPVTIICDNVREPGNLGSILRTAAAVGCQKIFLTKGTVDVWNTKVLRSAAGAHFHTSIRKDIEWAELKECVRNSSIFIADNNVSLLDLSASPKRALQKVPTDLPSVTYYEVDFTDCKSIALVIGGETEGIGEEAYRLAYENSGSRLHVPLSNDVESLNTGTALGIVLFEIKRQFLINRSFVNIQENKV